MAKTETNVSTLKINRGTYAKVQENLSSITENELIITSDKNVPIPTTNDVGKAPIVNASGEYELGNAGTNVVANPTLAGTETALTGLQVGDTKYALKKVFHIYTSKTYTPSDSDYAQLVEDLSLGREIAIDGFIFYMVAHPTTDVWRYSSMMANGGMNNKYPCYYVLISKSGDNYILSNMSTVSITDITVSQTLSFSNPRPVLSIGGITYAFVGTQTAYSTIAPTVDNTSGYLQTVVLTSEPATYYNGYYYIIAPST